MLDRGHRLHGHHRHWPHHRGHHRGWRHHYGHWGPMGKGGPNGNRRRTWGAKPIQPGAGREGSSVSTARRPSPWRNRRAGIIVTLERSGRRIRRERRMHRLPRRRRKGVMKKSMPVCYARGDGLMSGRARARPCEGLRLARRLGLVRALPLWAEPPWALPLPIPIMVIRTPTRYPYPTLTLLPMPSLRSLRSTSGRNSSTGTTARIRRGIIRTSQAVPAGGRKSRRRPSRRREEGRCNELDEWFSDIPGSGSARWMRDDARRPDGHGLSGPGKPFEVFQADDYACRQWAQAQICWNYWPFTLRLALEDSN